MTTRPPCPRCTAPVQPDWDWCRQCGYDPDGLKPPDAELAGAGAAVVSGSRAAKTRSRSQKRAAAKLERQERKRPAAGPDESLVPGMPGGMRPPPPRQPTETVYGLLPYDHPSSVVPVEPDPPDLTERNERRFAIVALCVIVVGLVLLVLSLVSG